VTGRANIEREFADEGVLLGAEMLTSPNISH